jgi:uncharacterized membrane protein
MFRPKHGWTDEQVEQVVGDLLRIGVGVAALVVLAGGVMYLIRYGAALPDYAVFRGEPAELRSLFRIVTDALSFRPRGLIQLGLVLLIATPVARVAFSTIAFALQRDRTYVIVTLMVLCGLIYSLAGGSL